MKYDKRIDIDTQKEEAIRNIERINFWIANCDTKISFSLGFTGILIAGFLSSSMISDSLKKTVKLWKEGETQGLTYDWIYTNLTLLILGLFVLTILLTLTYLFRAKKGRVNPNVFNESGLETKSVLFFNSIKDYEFKSYKYKYTRLTESALLNDYISQVYISSKICSVKFALYQKGVNSLITSTILFIILIALLMFM